MTSPARIPAFVNPRSGSAEQVRAALEADPRFDLRVVDPQRLAELVRAEAARGTPRVAVAGGDGTIAQGAGAAAGTPLEVAVLPGGTLNHFARDIGIPLGDFPAALDVAATGDVRPVDLAYVNDRAVLNTSSVGLYVLFVRTREQLERRLGYHLASVVAAIRVWAGLRGFVVAFRTSDGIARTYRTPLLFVGVGERALERAANGLGARMPTGAHALHVLVVRANTPSSVAALAFGALFRGVRALTHGDALDAFLVDECTVTMRRKWGNVSIDGELVRLPAPLHYRLERGAVRVVHPRDGVTT
ncbi:diacylglycerol kinase catalytic region [Gemmatirosa kalamazoonensis]|uniref:Diacylglycerol kinase catalytic region n=1 Tax=Gemmatirosa kalamazoonensis TaxID=861299 RepID=W0RHI0_9BACT|nr:diacylglycerol kinase family protein [Gemmatirosa kalamazoonensis]AHG89882.1 diacylglycerol kinase catalytic region [Gemmatirosa kalamazoonensis]